MRRLIVVRAIALVTAVATLATPMLDASAVAAPTAQRGVTIWAWTETAYGSPEVGRALVELRELGATWVTFTPTWFQADGSSTSIHRRPGFTATDAALERGIAAAHAAGLHVMLKPQLDRDDGGWRGDIRPTSRRAWFASDRAMVLAYAELAARTGVEQLAIGTELAGVSNDELRWGALIGGARRRFDGLLTYVALPFEYERVQFWKRLDLVGVNAWWKLTPVSTESAPLLDAAWAPRVAELEAFSRRIGKPILLTEAGFTSQRGTTTDPSSWSLSTVPAPAEQAAGYESLLRAFAGRPWFAGVHWWAWRETNASEPLDFTPQGKPAEAVLRRWWAPT